MDRKSLGLYQRNLDTLEKAALIDLQDWWEQGNRYDRDPYTLLDASTQPFYAIAKKYGDRAAAYAVNYLIMSRSLDDELRFLPRPTMAEISTFEQVQNNLSWAINTSIADGTFQDLAAFKKLKGIMTRIVLNGARDTVLEATRRDGTYYARIPEPGACPFCLMLSSRGAVYTKDTVTQTKAMTKYHDHCRCIGVEATEGQFGGLPPVNRELRELWDANVGADAEEYWPSEKRRAEWRNLIITMRRAKTQSDNPVKWPPINGIKTPSYSWSARYTTFGKPEPLPKLDKMPGHVLYGWKDGNLPTLNGEPVSYGREAHTKSDRQGHRWGSTRPGATVFPKDWSDQKIVDAVAETIEDPDEYKIFEGESIGRTVRKTVDGVEIEAHWIVRDGHAKFINAKPLRGPGVSRVNRQGRMEEAFQPSVGRKNFTTVRR